MKLQSRKLTVLAKLLVAAVIPFLSVPATADTSNYAMIMPQANQSMLLDIAVAGSRLVAVGERGHILYSEDSGESWTQAKVPTTAMLTRVFFANADTGWAVGHDGNILLSRDGGVHWELQRDGVSAQALVNEQRAGRAKETMDALLTQLAESEAGEEAKAELVTAVEEAEYKLEDAHYVMDAPVFAPPLMDIWFANEQQGWASGAYGTLLYTTNGGQMWQDWAHNVDNPDQLHLNGVIGVADGALYLASEWGTVFRSTDSGISWTRHETGYDGSYFGVLVNPETKTVFAYGLRGTVYRSTDGGDSWTQRQSKARASLLGSSAIDGTLIFVGQGGTAVLSRDDGDSFQALVQPLRAGIYGIAQLPDASYMVSGDGGSRPLVMDSAKPAMSQTEQAGSSQEAQQ